MFAGSKAAITMTQKNFRYVAALVLLGIAIGCAISHFYFSAFLSDRAEDGMPISLGGKIYEVREADRDIRPWRDVCKSQRHASLLHHNTNFYLEEKSNDCGWVATSVPPHNYTFQYTFPARAHCVDH